MERRDDIKSNKKKRSGHVDMPQGRIMLRRLMVQSYATSGYKQNTYESVSIAVTRTKTKRTAKNEI